MFINTNTYAMNNTSNYVNLCLTIQARIAQLVAYWLGIGEFLGFNPGKGENFSVKIK